MSARVNVVCGQKSRSPSPRPMPLRWVNRSRMVISWETYGSYNCGFGVPKGTAEKMQATSIADFWASIVEVAPFLRDRVAELRYWSDVKLLAVKSDRLQKWHRPGLLCIGDAAHAMSPVGGVGINLAIQDAVAA